MYLKLTSVKDGKIANKWPAIFVKGTKLDNGEEWEKAFFANQQDLSDKIKNFDMGEEINVIMEQKGKNWNIIDFKAMGQGDYDKIESKGNGGGYAKGKPSVNGGGSAPAAAAATTTKSTWGGRTGEAYDRSSAIYLAMDVLKTVKSEAQLRKTSPAALVAELTNLAEPIYRYIHDGSVLAGGTDKGDALEPPSLD